MDQASASRELSSPQAKTAKDSSLLDLPQGVLALIISFSAPNSKRQHPLLAVCRATRDAVLQTLQELTLKFEGVLRIPPLAGLLHRACCAARAGLTIILQCQSAWADAVLQLGVQHLSNDSLGVEHTGWDRVHTLECRRPCLSPQQLHSAFPTLHTLVLRGVDLGDGALLVALEHSHPQLQSLALYDCSINEAAVQPSAAGLSHLHHLTAFDGSPGVCLDLARQVTGLTSLTVTTWWPEDIPAQAVQLAVQNQSLERFRCNIDDLDDILTLTTEGLRELLEGCPNLTDLDLSWVQLTCESLDTVLTHGTRITSLSVLQFDLAAHENRADSPCSWRSLTITRSANILQFALLPLKGVQALKVASSDRLYLELPCEMEAAQVPALLTRAVTNLTACPAWRRGQVPGHNLYLGYCEGEKRSASSPWTPHDRLQLFTALAPVAGHTQAFEVDCPDLRLGKAEAGAVAAACGATLRSLHLTSCQLISGFWPGLVQALPQLTEISVWPNVEVCGVELGVFCGMRAAATPAVPFTLRISREPHGKVLTAGLERGLGREHSCVQVEYWRWGHTAAEMSEDEGESVEGSEEDDE